MASWLSSVRPDDRVVTCTFAQGRRWAELETKTPKLLASLPCEPIPPVAGDLYATVKLAQQRGLSLDENDLWTAATAIAINATLVSNDSDFQRIDTLAVAVS